LPQVVGLEPGQQMMPSGEEHEARHACLDTTREPVDLALIKEDAPDARPNCSARLP
jgi:hypothetical protein